MGDVGPTRTPRSWAVTVIAAAGLTAYLVLALLRLRGTPDVDLWLHLRIGDHLLAGRSFGLPDPFVTLADHAYRPNQWFADVAGSWVWSVGGMPAVQLLRLLGVMLLVAVVWAAAREAAGPTGAAIATVPATFATGAAWAERPQLLGMVFLAVAFWAWWRALRTGRTPWFLVPLTCLWAGVHGMWVVGVGLGLVFVPIVRMDCGPALRPALWHWGLVPLGSVVAAGLTPLGPSNLLDPITVGSALRGRVNEWQPPSPANPLLLVVLAMAVMTVALWWHRQRGLRWGRLLLLAAGVVLAASAVRLLAVGAILVAPVLAEAIGEREDAGASEATVRLERLTWGAGAMVVAVVGGWLAVATSHPEPVSSSVSRAMSALPPGTPVATDAAVMGWTEWAHPQLRPLRDLRSELYDVRTATAYDAFLRGGPGWDGYAATHRLGAVLVAVRSPLVVELAAAGWTKAASDVDYSLWLAPRPDL